MMNSAVYRGRIAPSPSGYLHIGHVSTFKTARARADKFGGTLVLRIEDIDRARCKPKYLPACIEDLKRAGIVWDEGPEMGGNFGPYFQSMRTAYYAETLRKLARKNLIYPCFASRADIRRLARPSTSIFNRPPAEPIFPAELRRDTVADIDSLENPLSLNWRFRVPDGLSVSFNDNNFGKLNFVSGEDFGDFLVWRKFGEPVYELAVVADDISMKITEVVRGADLLLSTARQLLLYKALEADAPQFYHCELLNGDDGRKLSKSTMKCCDKKWLVREGAKL